MDLSPSPSMPSGSTTFPSGFFIATSAFPAMPGGMVNVIIFGFTTILVASTFPGLPPEATDPSPEEAGVEK